MKTMMYRVAILLSLLANPGQAENAPPKTGGNKGVYKDGAGGLMDSVLLKDYDPKSSLVVAEHLLTRAKFPVIDVHTHMSQCKIKTKEDVADWVRVMDQQNIDVSVVFTGATGENFDRAVELFAAYPKRFQLWCSFDSANIGDPDYSKRGGRRAGPLLQQGRARAGRNHRQGLGIATGWEIAGRQAHARGRPAHGSHLGEMRRVGDAD